MPTRRLKITTARDPVMTRPARDTPAATTPQPHLTRQ
jgi:hypothetical protein